ncbi:MAG TPA: FAD-binding oxidoreductase [Streptosporangiaceae bacterium]|nr:FAD-binding oxidoreductase [Streptosporangiaceae bacterium]
MTLEAALRTAVGSEHVLLDRDLRASYETDWTGRFAGPSRAVARPADTAQVAQVLAACADAGVPVVVQGGRTGLVGGSVPPPGPAENPPVVLLTTRLTELTEISQVTRQVTAGAGVTLAALTAHARAAGLDFGVDLAARDSATVGGMVATNAGGIRVLRYGSMRDQVAGVEAALVDGRIITRLDGLAKDNTGYDFSHLLAGSEGTLAVLTRLRLRLVPADRERAVALIAVRGTAEAVGLLAALRSQLPGLSAAELCFPSGLALVARITGLRVPMEGTGKAYVLVEVAGESDPVDDLLAVLERCEQVLDATVASSAADRAQLWALRERHTEAINSVGVPVKLDVSVPLVRLAELVDRLPGAVAAVEPTTGEPTTGEPTTQLVLFGHLAEANLHVNVLGARDAEAVTVAVLSLVSSLGGSISSEHGIGRAKARWLDLSRSRAEIDVMRAIKAAFDPLGLLNPGVLLRADDDDPTAARARGVRSPRAAQRARSA